VRAVLPDLLIDSHGNQRGKPLASLLTPLPGGSLVSDFGLLHHLVVQWCTAHSERLWRIRKHKNTQGIGFGAACTTFYIDNIQPKRLTISTFVRRKRNNIAPSLQ
jgi:hypothetical protein